MLEILNHQFVWMGVLCSLILAGIHAYLGFHIVSRGVIFVDLSLAQMAAVGAALAAVLGIEEGTPLAYISSLSFTFVGAWIVSISRVRNDRIPQEAFIGILYAASAALTILLLQRHPGGLDELHHLMAGSILTVQPKDIVTITIIYSVIGTVHFMFRKRFFTITQNRGQAEANGWSINGWDFLFYATFAIVVTSSVAVAGVLLVFSLLVIPPVVALFFADGAGKRLALGWVVAVLGALGGIVLSIGMDLPAGPAIIMVLVAILIAAATIYRVRKARTTG